MKCKCIVCLQNMVRPALLCTACRRSLDYLTAHDDGSIHSVLAWAAKRARTFERRRAAVKARQT